MWKVVVGTLLLVGLGSLVATKLIDNAVDEYYSPGYITESIAEARTRGVLLSQLALKSNVIRWEKSEYLIREAWIEQATHIKYDWIFFRRVIPTKHRLILIVERTGKPPGKNFSDYTYEGKTLICNNSIFVTTERPGTPAPSLVLMYSEFSSPVPASIQCVVKKPN